MSTAVTVQVDESIWNKVKDGSITGFSVERRARVKRIRVSGPWRLKKSRLRRKPGLTDHAVIFHKHRAAMADRRYRSTIMASIDLGMYLSLAAVIVDQV